MQHAFHFTDFADFAEVALEASHAYGVFLADIIARGDVLDAYCIAKVMDDGHTVWVTTRKDEESGYTVPTITLRSYDASRWSRRYCENLIPDLDSSVGEFVVMRHMDAYRIDLAQTADTCERVSQTVAELSETL